MSPNANYRTSYRALYITGVKVRKAIDSAQWLKRLILITIDSYAVLLKHNQL